MFRKITRITLLFYMLLFFKTIAYAEDHEILLSKIPIGVIDDDPIGQRSAPCTIICVINENDILIDDVDVTEIISYEVFDMNGTCILSSSEQQQFILFIQSYSGEGDIKIVIPNYILIGCISK